MNGPGAGRAGRRGGYRQGSPQPVHSPQAPDGSLSVRDKHGLAFTVLSDPGTSVARDRDRDAIASRTDAEEIEYLTLSWFTDHADRARAWNWALAAARALRPVNYAMNTQLNAGKKTDPLESRVEELRELLPPGAVIIGGARLNCEVVIIPGGAALAGSGSAGLTGYRPVCPVQCGTPGSPAVVKARRCSQESVVSLSRGDVLLSSPGAVELGILLLHLAGVIVVADDVAALDSQGACPGGGVPGVRDGIGQRSRELAMIARSKVTVIPVPVLAGRNPVRGPPASSARRAAIAASGCPASVRKASAGRV
jgi:hypothetical protein